MAGVLGMTRVKVGGQALPDGVVMRTSHAWAVARADGTVETGAVPQSRLGHIPVLRVLSGVLLGLRVGFGRRRTGPRRASSNSHCTALPAIADTSRSGYRSLTARTR